MKHLYFSLLLLLATVCGAQNPVYAWSSSYGSTNMDGVNDLAIDNAGNVYVVGRYQLTVTISTITLVSSGGVDIFMAKYDPNGNILWAKGMGNSSGEEGFDIALDNSNNIYITGFFNGTVDFDPSASTATFASVGGDDIFFAKYDNNGNYIWAKTMGSTTSDQGKTIYVNNTGEIFLGGYYHSTADLDPGPAVVNFTAVGQEDCFFGKYDSNGNYQWVVKAGGMTFDEPVRCVGDASGNIYFCGFFMNTVDFDPSASVANLVASGNEDGFMAKYDNAGNYVWAKKIGGTYYEGVRTITLDNLNNVIISGYFSQTTDFDPSAAVYTIVALGSQDIFVSKYDNAGNFIWANDLGNSSGTGSGNGITCNSANDIYLVGSITGTVDFDPSANTYTLGSAGSTDFYISKYYSNGGFSFARSIGAAGVDGAAAIAVDGANNMFVGGVFNNSVDFDPLPSVAFHTSGGSNDGFVAKYTPCTSVSSTLLSQQNLTCASVYNGSAAVSASGGPPITYTWLPSGGNSSSAINLAAGIYTCVVTNSCTAFVTTTVQLTAPPGVSLTTTSNPTIICPGNPATLTALGSGGVGSITYSWSTGPTTTLINVSPIVTTNYTVKATDATMCSKTVTVTQLVSTASLNTISNPNILCIGDTATITASAIGNGPFTYTWSTGPTVPTITVNPVVTSVYTIAVTDANTCIKTFSVNQVVSPNMTLSATSNPSVLCPGNSATITSSISGGTAPFSYSWSTSSTASTTMVNPTLTTTYTLEVDDAGGCTKTLSVNQVVDPVITLSTTSNPTMLCPGNTVTITSNIIGGTAPFTHSWSTTSTVSAINVSPSVTINYTVKVTDVHTCNKTYSFTQLVSPTIGLSSLSNPTSVCSGDTATLSVVATGTAPFTYAWSNGPVVPTITVNPLATSIYTVTVTDANLCSKAFSVSQLVQTTMTISAVSNPSVLCIGNSATITSNVVGTGPFTYTWSTGPTTSVAIVNPTVSTMYTLTVIDANSCKDTLLMNQMVQPSMTLSAIANPSLLCAGNSATITSNVLGTGPFTYSWSSGSTNSIVIVSPSVNTIYTLTVTGANSCKDTLSVSQMVSPCTGFQTIFMLNDLNIVPNPANEFITVVDPTNTHLRVIIYNMLGLVVKEESIMLAEQKIMMNDLEKGLYLVSVFEGAKLLTSKKIIKQ